MTDTIIKELVTKEDILNSFPVVQQLRTQLNEDQYVELVAEAMNKDHYRMFALLEEEDILAVIGFKPMITLYYGKFVWVENLVTGENARSQGHGEMLLNFVHDWAGDHHYKTVALSSGLERTEAHRFYEDKIGYDKVSFVFKK